MYGTGILNRKKNGVIPFSIETKTRINIVYFSVKINSKLEWALYANPKPMTILEIQPRSIIKLYSGLLFIKRKK